jgi:cytoskeletal protein CcmA (bactofilin family)
MFKKLDTEFTQPEQPPSVAKPTRTEPRREAATIGPSISIKGDLTGEEDLVIQGRVEGKIDLKQNSVTIGKDGKAKADIYGKQISVEGDVDGNLHGLEQVSLRSSASVRGNICAPRVSIEDGAKFKGTIDMEVKTAEKHPLNQPVEPIVSVVAGSPGSPSLARAGISMKIEPPNSRA